MWKMLTSRVVRHWCGVAERMVSTIFFEERCPYCKQTPPQRPPL